MNSSTEVSPAYQKLYKQWSKRIQTASGKVPVTVIHPDGTKEVISTKEWRERKQK